METKAAQTTGKEGMDCGGVDQARQHKLLERKGWMGTRPSEVASVGGGMGQSSLLLPSRVERWDDQEIEADESARVTLRRKPIHLSAWVGRGQQPTKG
jgi:hypothetical protein